jgi:UDP-N-acetyl-D-mannosaminuronate dehydrogenase
LLAGIVPVLILITLPQKAQEVGYHPEIILAGRRLNDGMGTYVALEVIKLMIKKDIAVKNSKILVLGFTFKENCPDVRNTRVIDIVNVLMVLMQLVRYMIHGQIRMRLKENTGSTLKI